MDEKNHSLLTFLPRDHAGLRHEISTNQTLSVLPDAHVFRQQLEDFIHAIRCRTQPRVSGRQGLASTSLIEQCYQARTPVAEPWVNITVPKLRAVRDRESAMVRPGLEAARHENVEPRGRTNPGSEVVLITGSTGFIGSRLCEVISLTTDWTVRPFVHSPGKASYIARYPFEFWIADLTDLSAVRRAMEGCTSVVHLARGSNDVMRKGLDNLLRAAVEAKVRRFVHLSSVAVFGDDPPPAARYETAIPRKTANPYGNIKLEQEKLVLKYGKRHRLPFVILRPPHVYGPYSHFTPTVLEKLKATTLPIVDGGTNTCNLVYIDNLVQAVLLSLMRDEARGQTFFVVDKDRVTWRKCLEDHGALLGVRVLAAGLSQLQFPSPPTLVESLGQIRAILSATEIRSVVSKNALLARVARVGDKLTHHISSKASSPLPASRTEPPLPRYDATDYLIAGQRRKVEHSCEKAERMLGYTAPVNYDLAMELITQWLQFAKVI